MRAKKLSTKNLHLEGPVKRSRSVEPADFAQAHPIISHHPHPSPNISSPSPLSPHNKGSETTTAQAGIISPVNNSASDNHDYPASDNRHFQSVRNNIATQSLPPTNNNDSAYSNQDVVSDNYHRGRHGIVINNTLSPFVPWKKITYFGPDPNEISHHANISSVSLFHHRGPPETTQANISICPINLAPSNNRDPSSAAPLPNHHRESATATLGQNNATYRSCPPNKISRRHDGIPSPPTLVNVTLPSNNLSDNHDRAAAASDNHKRHRSANHRVHKKSLVCSPTAPVSLGGYNFAIRTLEEWVAQ